MEGRTSLFLGNRDLLLHYLPLHKAPSLCVFFCLLLCSLSLSFLILLHLYTRSLTHSGMRSYPLWLRHPQTHTLYCTHKHMQITQTHTPKKNSCQSISLESIWVLPAATLWNMCFCVIFLLLTYPQTYVYIHNARVQKCKLFWL